MQNMKDPTECNVCYPEVYYRIQPIIMSACDMMDYDDVVVTSQEMFDRISDNIYADVCRMHPELVEYASCQDMRFSVESQQRDFDRDRRDFDRDRRDRDRDRDRERDRFPFFRFRRRGIFRDFIDLLILNELLRRGRVIF